MKSDIVGAFLLVGSAIAVSLWIRQGVKVGHLRLRGGATVHRNERPRLFLGIIAFSWTFVAMIVLALLLELDHDVICGGQGTPRNCVVNQLHVLGN